VLNGGHLQIAAACLSAREIKKPPIVMSSISTFGPFAVCILRQAPKGQGASVCNLECVMREYYGVGSSKWKAEGDAKDLQVTHTHTRTRACFTLAFSLPPSLPPSQSLPRIYAVHQPLPAGTAAAHTLVVGLLCLCSLAKHHVARTVALPAIGTVHSPRDMRPHRRC